MIWVAHSSTIEGNKMKRNKKLFEKIADVIEKYPEMHNQAYWGNSGFGYNERAVNIYDVPRLNDKTIVVDNQEYNCGTSHCVLGWAVVLSNVENVEAGFSEAPIDSHCSITDYLGKELLGLYPSESEKLFYGCLPSRFDNYPEYLRHIANGGSVFEEYM